MRSKLKMITVLFLAISVCWMAHHAEATILFKKDFANLVQEADGIVVGTVEKVNSYYDSNKEIFTFVTLTDLKVISGNYAGNEFTIRLMGGRIDGDILEIQGSPQFYTGEQVVLFVQGNGKLAVPIVGWTQGVLRVVSLNGRQIIEDYYGNPVVGIRDGKFQKEMRNVSEATLVDPKTGAIVSEDLHIYQSDGNEAVVSKMISPEREVCSGQPEDDNTTKKETSLSNDTKMESLTLDEFINSIVRLVRTKVNKTVSLESADVMDLNTPANQDGILKGQSPTSLKEQTEVEPFLPKHDKEKPVGEDSQPAQQ